MCAVRFFEFRGFYRRDSPVSSIQQALSKLNSAVGRLEMSAHSLERSRTGQQRDMFAQPTATKPGAFPDSAVIAKRLDKAIKKVEELLDS